MRSSPSLPSFSGPIWPGVLASDKVLFMDQTELNCVIMLNWIVWNRTVWSFNCVKTNDRCLIELFRYIAILGMVLDASSRNTQHYKVSIKGKVGQSRERSSAFTYNLV